MIPEHAKTASGMGTKPRIVVIRYKCDGCGKIATEVKKETTLIASEQKVWEKLSAESQ